MIYVVIKFTNRDTTYLIKLFMCVVIKFTNRDTTYLITIHVCSN